MAKITGIGGVFFKSKHDAKSVRAWYSEKLGIEIDDYGGHSFKWNKDTGRTVWSIFEQSSDYFAPSGAPFMINYRVDNLPEFLEEIKANGVEQVGKLEEFDYGKFAWILDLDGNKLELWEPTGEEIFDK